MWANNLLYGFKNEWIIRGKLVESCHRNPILAWHTNLFLNGQTASGNFLVTKIRPKIELTHEILMKASKWIKHLYKNLRLEYNPEAVQCPKNLGGSIKTGSVRYIYWLGGLKEVTWLHSFGFS